MTFNVWNYTRPWPARRDAIVALISTLQPDVVALQEIRHDFRFERGLGQHEQLAQRTGYTATWALGQRYLPLLRIDEGVALLTREPPIRTMVKHLAIVPTERNDENHRVCLGAELRAGERSIYAFSTHFSLSPAARQRNAREVAEYVDVTCNGAPAFVMGDLNEPPSGAAIRYLTETAGFLDAWTAVHPDDAGFTYASWQPYHRIDFVLVRNVNRPVTEVHTVGDRATHGVYPSDHLGVLVDVRLGPA